MKKLYFSILTVLAILTISCSSNRKGIIICDTAIDTSKFTFVEVLFDSVKFNAANRLLNLSGKIIDPVTREGLAGANIALTPKMNKLEGVSTDLNGEFKIEFNMSKYDSLDIRVLGYKQTMVSIDGIYNKYIQKNKSKGSQ